MQMVSVILAISHKFLLGYEPINFELEFIYTVINNLKKLRHFF
jgi:hypothetical protein